jgi:hypothetical protein
VPMTASVMLACSLPMDMEVTTRLARRPTWSDNASRSALTPTACVDTGSVAPGGGGDSGEGGHQGVGKREVNVCAFSMGQKHHGWKALAVVVPAGAVSVIASCLPAAPSSLLSKPTANTSRCTSPPKSPSQSPHLVQQVFQVRPGQAADHNRHITAAAAAAAAAVMRPCRGVC